MVNTIFDAYMSGKRKHFEDLRVFNNKIKELDTALLEKNRQASEIIDKVRDLGRDFSQMEVVKREKEGLEKKVKASEAALLKVMQQLIDLKARTERVTEALKADLAKKNQTISKLERQLKLAETLKADLANKKQIIVKTEPGLSSYEEDAEVTAKHLATANKLHLLIAHTKKNLATSETKVVEQEKMITFLRKQNDGLKARMKAELYEHENDELKREVRVQDQCVVDIMEKVEVMNTNVNAAMENKAVEISRLQR